MWARWSDDAPVKLARDVVGLLAGPVLGGVLRLRGTISLHASVVEIASRAVVLVGHRGAGKSTLAAAMAQEGHPILSDDVAAVTEDGGHWVVEPGYPCLRLKTSAFETLDPAPPNAGLAISGLEKRYVALSDAPDARCWRFQPRPLPLGTILELRRDPEVAAPSFERVDGAERLTLLLDHRRTGLGDLDRAAQDRELRQLARLGTDVPVWRVSYPDRLEDLSATQALLVDRIQRG